MSTAGSAPRVDKASYDQVYKTLAMGLEACRSPEEYRRRYEAEYIAPLHRGGGTKGYVRGLAVQRLIEHLDGLGRPRSEVTVLDAGCGRGGLSVYLACLGYSVVGVDISETACATSAAMAHDVGVQARFVATSLGDLSALADASIDGVVGHGSLHHFIKYDDVPPELHRVMKPGAKGFFADAFGENRAFHLFHDKAKMERLGDVVMDRQMIRSYFADFDVELVPTDWFVMLDKLWLRLGRARGRRLVRGLSRVHHALDRRVPANELTLGLSGSVLTVIRRS